MSDANLHPVMQAALAPFMPTAIDPVQRAKVAALVALTEVAEYLEARSDVIDGDYGSPEPNPEMTLLQEVERAIRILEAS